MAQISKGWQYEPTGDKSQVTHENLNAHVDNATLTNGAIVEQDLVTFANTDDLLLLSQAGSLVSITKGNFIANATQISNGYINFGIPTYEQGVSTEIGSGGFRVFRKDGGNTYNYFSVFGAGSQIDGVNQSESGVVQTSRLVVDNVNTDTLAYGGYWGNRLELTHGTKLIVHGRNRTNDFTPAGSIIAFAGETAPDGWIVCDGRTLDGTSVDPNFPDREQFGDPIPTYYRLWQVLGTTYGGTGQSSFKIPDLRGEFIRGYDHGNGNDPRVFGSKQKDLLKAHKHISSNNDCQDYSGINGTGTGVTNTWCDTNGGYAGAGCSLTGDGQHPEQVVSGVPTVGHETRPRNIALNYIIKY